LTGVWTALMGTSGYDVAAAWLVSSAALSSAVEPSMVTVLVKRVPLARLTGTLTLRVKV
jgi:hypothetical protein